MRPAHQALVPVAVAGIAAFLFALHSAPSLTASNPTTPVVSIDPPSIVATPGALISVTVLIDGVTDKSLHHPDEPGGLGAFEFTLPFDPASLSFKSVTVGPFLGSSGRQVTCLPPQAEMDRLRFGCVTEGSGIGASGGGVLATLQFNVFCPTDAELEFRSVGLAEPFGKAIPVQTQGGQASCSAGQTVTPTATHTATPPSKPLGDVDDNMSVESTDALLILQYVVGFINTLINPGSADLNGDEAINSVDAALVLQCVVGFIDICH